MQERESSKTDKRKKNIVEKKKERRDKRKEKKKEQDRQRERAVRQMGKQKMKVGTVKRKQTEEEQYKRDNKYVSKA